MQVIYSLLMGLRPAPLASALKRLLFIRRRILKTKLGSFFIDPASNFGFTLFSKGRYEPEMIDALQRLLVPGDTFLDIGANEGYFSVLASRLVGATGSVIAVEPQSRLQSVLFRNIAENGAFNLQVFQRVLADSAGVATLSLSPDMNTGSSGVFRTARYRVPSEQVPQTTLATFLGLLSVERIKLMKMDVEGFEYEVVLGSKDVFRSGRIEYIALELHPQFLERRGKSESDILAFLHECGYVVQPGFGTLVLKRTV